MSFTDENLRYAKQWKCCRSLDEFEALLDRLDCAELVCRLAEIGAEGNIEWRADMSEALSEWLRSCGKGEK